MPKNISTAIPGGGLYRETLIPPIWCPSISGAKCSDSGLVRINTAFPPHFWQQLAPKIWL